MPGSNLHGVFLLRSRDDAEMMLASLEGARQALVVEASFIGLEVASSLRKRGMDVAVAAPETLLHATSPRKNRQS